MLRLTFTAHTPERAVLGYLDMQNDGTGTPEYGHYACRLLDAEAHLVFQVVLEEYPRAAGAWELARRALVLLEQRHGWPLSAPLPPA